MPVLVSEEAWACVIWALQPLCSPPFCLGQMCAPGAQQPLNFPEEAAALTGVSLGD